MGFLNVPCLTLDDFHGTPNADTFGVRLTDEAIKLCCTDWIDGDWRIIKPELEGAVRRFEPRAQQWRRTSGEEMTSYWWFETVRASRDVKIQTGDRLVIAFYPDTKDPDAPATVVDLAPFKSYNKNRKERVVDPLSMNFESEDAFFRWIASLAPDYWQQSEFRVARSACPIPALPTVRYAAPKLAYGLLRGKDAYDTIRESVLERDAVQDVLQGGERDLGADESMPPSASSDSLDLFPPPKDRAMHYLDVALKMALAGPIQHDSDWYEKPIWQIVVELYPKLVRYSRTHASLEERVERVGMVLPLEPPQLPSSLDTSSDDLHPTLRALEIRRSDLERKIQSLAANLSAIQNAIQSTALESTKKQPAGRSAKRSSAERGNEDVGNESRRD